MCGVVRIYQHTDGILHPPLSLRFSLTLSLYLAPHLSRALSLSLSKFNSIASSIDRLGTGRVAKVSSLFLCGSSYGLKDP